MKNTKLTYHAPEVDILEIHVENGIAQSLFFGNPGGAGAILEDGDIYNW